MWGFIGSRARSAERRGAPRLRTGVVLVGALAIVGATVGSQSIAAIRIGGASVAGAAANTVVSIEFDDGLATQYQTRAMLSARGMHGTYYINSNPRPPGFNTLSWSQLHDLANDGNEIGGHTLDHADLPTVSTAQATRQICDDRTALQAQGFTVKSFAYPYGHFNAAIENITRNCGYTSARGVDGIVTPEGCGGNCPFAESIPPKDAFATRTPENADESTPLSELEGFVTQAEQHGGGWVQLVFRDICSPGPSCDFYSIPPAQFATLLDWIAARASNGTVVRTVGQVMGTTVDSTPPASSIACNGGGCTSGFYTGPVQVSLAAADNSGGSGVSVIRYTTDGTTPSRSGSGGTTYAGPFTLLSTTTVSYRAFDNAGNAESTNSRVVSLDTTPPAAFIACNGGYCPDVWLRAPVIVSLSAFDDPGGSGVAAIRVTSDGSDPTTAGAAYSGPFTVTSPVTLKYRAWDNAGNAGPTITRLVLVDTIAPIPTITCNGVRCNGSRSHRPVRVGLSATDAGGSGLDVIRYTKDGSMPTAASPRYSEPFIVSVSTTVRFRAVDNAGMSSSVHSTLIRIDTKRARR